jgi:hypothetical protein
LKTTPLQLPSVEFDTIWLAITELKKLEALGKRMMVVDDVMLETR